VHPSSQNNHSSRGLNIFDTKSDSTSRASPRRVLLSPSIRRSRPPKWTATFAVTCSPHGARGTGHRARGSSEPHATELDVGLHGWAQVGPIAPPNIPSNRVLDSHVEILPTRCGWRVEQDVAVCQTIGEILTTCGHHRNVLCYPVQELKNILSNAGVRYWRQERPQRLARAAPRTSDALTQQHVRCRDQRVRKWMRSSCRLTLLPIGVRCVLVWECVFPRPSDLSTR
jgi:hypothetical protein